MPTLLAINSTTPVRVRELGKGGNGIDWTCAPDTFPRVIAMVNAHGGPGCWSIEPV